MTFRDTFVTSLTTLALAFCISCPAKAQTENENVAWKIVTDWRVDCSRPDFVQAFPFRSVETAVFNLHGTSTEDVVNSTLYLFVFGRLHFENRADGVFRPAPAGYSNLTVLNANKVRTVWDLPNNQFVQEIERRGHSCHVTRSVNLKSGMKEYTLFDGDTMRYCSRIEVRAISCEIN